MSNRDLLTNIMVEKKINMNVVDDILDETLNDSLTNSNAFIPLTYDENNLLKTGDFYGTISPGGLQYLTAVNFKDDVEHIRPYQFKDCQILATVELPDTVKTIGKYAFYDCNALSSVNLPEGLESIGDMAFYNSGLGEPIILPSTLNSLGVGAFYLCYQSGFSSVTILGPVTTIPESCFSDCYNLRTVVLPTTVTTIGKWAFSYCGLTSISGLENVETFVEGALESNNITEFTIPAAVTILPEELLEGCNSLVTIDYATNNALAEIQLEAIKGCTALTTVSLPNTLTTIGNNAFEGCNHLTSIGNLNGVTTMGTAAFKTCTLLPTISLAKIGAIGNYSFQNDTSLTSVTLGSTGFPVATVSTTSFSGCTQNTLNITIFVDPASQPTGAPWGATNCIIVKKSSVDGSTISTTGYGTNA